MCVSVCLYVCTAAGIEGTEEEPWETVSKNLTRIKTPPK